jgi:hypothetical protein
VAEDHHLGRGGACGCHLRPRLSGAVTAAQGRVGEWYEQMRPSTITMFQPDVLKKEMARVTVPGRALRRSQSTASAFPESSFRYRRSNSFHFAGSCANRPRSSGLGARSKVLAPVVDGGSRLCYSAGPELLDEHPFAVRRRSLFIGTLEAYPFGACGNTKPHSGFLACAAARERRAC